MAYLITDDKQLQNGQNPQAQQEGQTLGSSSSGPAIVGGAGMSQAGVGKGGSGGWTNIQSYLDANKGSQQGSANLLSNKVGGSFSGEASRLAQESNKARNDAMSAVNNNTLDKSAAQNQVNSLASQYKYKGGQSDAYNQGVSKVKNAYNYDYNGPNSYAFGLNAKAQEYGAGLKTDPKFSSIMNALYGEAAGGQLGGGMANLQKQLDVNNPYLAQARGKLSTQYDDLNNNVGRTVKSTADLIENQKATALARKNDLRSYLGTQSTADYKSVDDARAKQIQMEKAVANAAQPYRRDEYFQSGTPRGQQEVSGIARGGSRIGGILNNDDYYKYKPSNPATLENIGGVETERNRWNAINEIIGNNNKINRSDENAEIGKYMFDYEAKHNAYKNWLESMGRTPGFDGRTVETQWD